MVQGALRIVSIVMVEFRFRTHALAVIHITYTLEVVKWLVLDCLLFDSLPISSLVLSNRAPSLSVGRITGIGRIEQILDADKNLPHRDCWRPPTGQDTQTDLATGVDVGMENGRGKLDRGRLTRIVTAKQNHHLVETALPVGTSLAGNASFPLENVGTAIALGSRACVKANRVVLAPLFALLQYTV